MDEGEGTTADQMDQFHRNEAISAVADVAFLGEEEEDEEDYEDLYNDVNVGEGFLQSLKKNEELGFKEEEEEVEERKLESPPKVAQEQPRGAVSIPGVGEGSGNVRVSGSGGYGVGVGQSNQGFRGNEMKGSGGIRVELVQHSKINEVVEEQSGFSNSNNNSNNVNINGNNSNSGVGHAVPVGVPGNIGELEAELCKYGAVKEVRFFDEKASGKSKGYCQVEFYDPASATACKEGMNGHLFNGRPCVVAFASPFSVKRMGEAQVNRNQQMAQSGVTQGRRGGPNDGGGIGATPPLLHPQPMMGQGFDPAFGGPMGRMGGYGGFPGAPTPPFSGILSSFPPVGGVGLPGVAPHVNPAFFGRGMPMNGMNGMGMMPTSGVDGPNMGMWSDPSMGGWGGEEHGGGRAGESSYGEEAASDHQYGEVSHDRAGWSNAMKEKDRGSERDWSGSSERRYRDDRDPGYDREMPREKDMGHDSDWTERRHRDDRDIGRERDRERDRDRERSRDRDREKSRDRDRDRERYRDDRDRYADHHRYRDREVEHEDEWERGRSSRTHSKSRISQEEEHHRSRSRDADYGKRRRLTSE
nr:isoform 2 of nipped-b-like protein b [Quercus suber]